ncbi:hypothetical protein MBLNU459_g4208t1 [Dothideomycetes sp. NU459]
MESDRSPRVSDVEAMKEDVMHLETIAIEEGAVKTTAQEIPEVLRDLSSDDLAAMERRLLWKIDLRILPVTIIMYILNYIDRNNIASARLGGLEKDLGLVGSQYQTCVSILFVGYVLMQVPSNLFLNRIGRPALFVPSAMIAWGIISGAAGAVHNFGGLLACRFLVGFVEAAFFPGCFYLLSCWYTRKELGLRTAMLFMGSLLSGAFAGLIAAGILKGMDGAGGLEGWRWLFIIEGAITVVVALSAMFILHQERALAIWRLQRDIGTDDWVSGKEQGLFHGLKLAVKDIKMWILMLIMFCISYSASIINFFPSVVATLGYKSRVITLCLTAPPYILCTITASLNAWHADRTGERWLHVVVPLCVGIVAYIIGAATTSTAPRYLSMMLILPGVYSGYPVVLAWITNSLPRPAAKRAASIALINSVLNIANIPGSYMYYNGAAPRYTLAFTMSAATSLVAISAATFLRRHLQNLNKALDNGKVIPEVGRDFRYLV